MYYIILLYSVSLKRNLCREDINKICKAHYAHLLSAFHVTLINKSSVAVISHSALEGSGDWRLKINWGIRFFSPCSDL